MFRPPPLPRTLEAALRDMADPKAAVRVDALSDLLPHAEQHRARLLPALESTFSDPDPRVRAAALRAASALEARELLPALLVACEDDDREVRQEAIATLGDIGDERASGKLSRALADPRPEVRFQAVMAYPRVCAEPGDAVDVLVKATHDEDEHVVQVALRMAEEVGSERAAGDDLADAFDDLEQAGPEVVPPAVLARARALLTHQAARVRVVAAIVVTRAGEAAGHPVILGVVDGSVVTPEAEDVAAAIGLAGRFEMKAAIPALEKRAFGGLLGFGRDAWSWHARTSLARMGHVRACREILRELTASDRTRRALAVVAAGKARLDEARPILERMRTQPRGVDPELLERALVAIASRAAGEGSAA